MAIRDGFIDPYFEDPNEMGANDYTAELATALLTPPAPEPHQAATIPADDPMGQAEQQAVGINAETLMNAGPMMPSKPGPFSFQQKRYKQELQQYKIEKEQYDAQQHQRQMQQFAQQAVDPRVMAGLQSGNPAIQKASLGYMFSREKQPRSESAIEFFQRDPEAYRRMEAAKKPLVSFDNGMKYPKGRVVPKEELRQIGLPTNATYWDKGDGSAPTKISGYSADQTKAANFGNHMKGANEVIDSMMNVDMFDPAAIQQNANRFGVPDAFAHLARTDAGKQYEAAKSEWLMAHLRKDSGASITRDDMIQAEKAFFPVPGDDKKTVQRKAEARAREMKGTIAHSGGAYEEIFNKDVRRYAKDEPKKQQQPRTAPQVGEIRPGDGGIKYEYIGGPSNKKESWRAVK